MNKKGQGISMTYIIIAALALVVLITIIIFFTGGMQALIGGQKEVVEGVVPDWKIKTWTTRCEFACSQENKVDFCETKFKAEEGADKYYVCNADNNKAEPTDKETTEEGLGIACDTITC